MEEVAPAAAVAAATASALARRAPTTASALDSIPGIASFSGATAPGMKTFRP